ncbi:MAG: bacterial transcriptional activator domain-containing protein [Pseudonocardia sp.]|uniref:AfsR/SARP family transcriptional regulator n=1 Tax=unclassified Pseudonocardia TaxID=2619320 RepID=UPI001ACAFCFB|nr:MULTISPECIES: bacterial transcriptional activator domain-containing protein [unclassified Pseudonocardia]MBN9108078.1 bacterial transcriptional activator domain-containing protein [Pseudonocardia sp.]
MSDDQRRSSTPGPGLQVSVLGSFTLTHDGVAVALGVDARRVVAYLAVHRRPQPLATLAADLWAGVGSDAALRLLDEAVADVDVPGLLVVDTLAGTVVLDSLVSVDLDEAMALVRLIPEVAAHEVADITLLRADVLPSWTAPWIAVERERFRQLRLNALEDLSLRLSAAGDHEQAVALARIAVTAAPSRENARRALIEAHLAQGDLAAAVAEYDDYQELLRSSVGGPVGSGLDVLFPPSPAWPVVRGFRPTAPRSAVALPGLRAVRTPGSRRLVAGGSIPSGR